MMIQFVIPISSTDNALIKQQTQKNQKFIKIYFVLPKPINIINLYKTTFFNTNLASSASYLTFFSEHH